MTLRSCYRASCDFPACTAEAWLDHERTGPARLELAKLGWSVIEHHVCATGAARIAYVCPDHHGWTLEDAAAKPTVGSHRERRRLRIRRAAMVWMLRELGADYPAIDSRLGTLGRLVGLSASRVREVVSTYERAIDSRRSEARDWVEPWAKRLRAAGAIP